MASVRQGQDKRNPRLCTIIYYLLDPFKWHRGFLTKTLMIHAYDCEKAVKSSQHRHGTANTAVAFRIYFKANRESGEKSAHRHSLLYHRNASSHSISMYLTLRLHPRACSPARESPEPLREVFRHRLNRDTSSLRYNLLNLCRRRCQTHHSLLLCRSSFGTSLGLSLFNCNKDKRKEAERG